MPDSTFTFSGDPSDANRATASIERNLEGLSRQAVQTSAALRTVGGPRNSALGGLHTDIDRTNVSLGRMQSGLRNVNVNFAAMRNVIGLLKFPAMIAALGLATQGLLALAAGGTAVVSALTPLVGLLGTMPGLLGAMVSSMLVVNLAFKDFSQALGGNADALKRLTPQARDFLRVIKDLRPFMRDLREEAQKGLFGGLTRGLESALTPQLKRTLEQGVGGIGQALGQGGARLGSFLGDPRTVQQLSSVMGQFQSIIVRMAPVLTHLANTFLTITVAAAPLTHHVEGLVRQFAAWIDHATSVGAATGKLTGFFRESGRTLDVVISLAKNFGGALLNIGKAAAPLGRTILKDLNDQAARLREITGSPEGQRSLAAYFERAKPGIYEIARLLRDVTKALIDIGDTPTFTPLIRQIRLELLPVLTDLIKSTAAGFGPALVTTLTQIAKVFAELGGASGPLTAFVRVIGTLAEALAKLIEVVPGLNSLIVTMVGMNSVMKVTQGLLLRGGITTAMSRFGAAVPTAAVAGAAPRAGSFAQRAASTGFGVMPTPVAFAPPAAPTIRGRIGGAASAAAPLVGSAAIAGGIGIGGTGGAALAGAGAGLILGTAVAPALGPFAPAGPLIGAGGGALVGVAASLLSGKKSADALAVSMGRLAGAMANVTTTGRALKDANENVRDSAINVKSAELSLEGAHAQRVAIMREGIKAARAEAEAQGQTFTAADLKRVRDHIKASYDYRVALQNEKVAEDSLRDSKRSSRTADRDRLTAIRASIAATNREHTSIRQTNQTYRDRLDLAEQTAARSRTAISDEERARRVQVAHNGVVQDYIAKMRALADQQRNHNQPELAKTSDRAADLAQKMNDIPTHKQIFVDIEVSANLSYAGARAEHLDLMNRGKPGSDGIVGVGGLGDAAVAAISRFGDSAVSEYMNRYGDGLASAAVAAFVGPAVGGNISPSLFDDIAIGRADGLVVTSGYRPGAITLSGNPSLHGTSPARAVDMSGSAAAMNTFFRQEIGRPGIQELIHNPYAWYPGAGLVNIAGTQLGQDHIDHVHVGVTGDGIIGAKMGEGFIGSPGTKDLWHDLLQLQHKMAERPGPNPGLQQKIADILGKIATATQHHDTILASRMQRLELRQQLAGTFDTLGGATARARFIRRNIIPTERHELHELRAEERAARRSHNHDLAKSIAEEIHAKQNEILQSQLDAQTAIKDATEATAAKMAAFGGSFGFEFGGSMWTDRLLGSGVGA